MNMSGKTSFSVVSIFTGAGGLDIGIERNDFHVVSALEKHPVYCETIHKNQAARVQIGNGRYYFQDTKIINDDIVNVSSELLKCGLDEIDCLIGGPPCQAFSSAGKQQSIFDQRGSLVYEYFRVLKELSPKVFLFENVRGLVTAKGKNAVPGEILQELLSLFCSLGYNCKVALLNSADFGSYQRRVRCFIIGSRIAAAPDFPIPTHSEHEELSLIPELSRQKWRTLGEFLDKYADYNTSEWVYPSSNLAEQLKDIPMGKGMRSRGRVEATRPGGHWGYRQGTFIADLSKPARTVTGSSSQDWIRMDDGTLRRITIREAARLQGFPDEWDFCGNKADVYQQIGNAVPTVFGEALGKVLYEYLDGGYQLCDETNEIMLPPDIEANIRYTIYDNIKNGAYRANKFPVK